MSPENPAGARRRYPLHIHLSALFSALVVATGVAIAWLGYGEARDITLKATDEVFRHVGAETRSALAGALQPVASFADLLALQPLARARTLERRLEALPVMRQGVRRARADRRRLCGLRRRQLFPRPPAAQRRGADVLRGPRGNDALRPEHRCRAGRRTHRHAPLLRRGAARARAPQPGRGRLRSAHAPLVPARGARGRARAHRAVRVLRHPGAGDDGGGPRRRGERRRRRRDAPSGVRTSRHAAHAAGHEDRAVRRGSSRHRARRSRPHDGASRRRPGRAREPGRIRRAGARANAAGARGRR